MFLHRFIGFLTARSGRRSQRRGRPALELLEARDVPAVISYPTFTSTEGLVLNGNAAQDGDMLNLAGGKSFARGSVFAQSPIQPGRSFTSTFVFQIDPQGSGITFIIQNDPRGVHALGGSGGALGLGEIGASDVKITPSVAVEFDVFFDEARFGQGFSLPFEPNNNHVGIDIAGDVQMTKPVQPTPGFNLFGQKVKATIAYTADNKMLKVFAGALESKQKLITSAKILMGQTVGAQGYAGFTSSTGNGTEDHFLMSWKFVQPGGTAATNPSNDASPAQRLAQGQLLSASLGTLGQGSKAATFTAESEHAEASREPPAAQGSSEVSKAVAASFFSAGLPHKSSKASSLLALDTFGDAICAL